MYNYCKIADKNQVVVGNKYYLRIVNIYYVQDFEKRDTN